MHTPHTRGFTLIELLVVIAIIGILSAVVIASLNTARTRANDAAVQSNLTGMQTQAEIYNSTNNGYGGTAVTVVTACNQNLFADPTIARAITSAQASAKGNVLNCMNTNSIYVIQGQINGGLGYWCVDSSGNSRSDAAAITTASTVCP